MNDKPLSPTNWLLREIEGYLPQATYDKLVKRFKAQQRRHNLYTKLKTACDELARYERMQQVASSQRWTDTLGRKIANRKRRIAELEAELETL